LIIEYEIKRYQKSNKKFTQAKRDRKGTAAGLVLYQKYSDTGPRQKHQRGIPDGGAFDFVHGA
jgi:hypothetical protein